MENSKYSNNYFILVPAVPPFLSLTSSDLTARKFPGALGVYRLTHTTIDPYVLGYSLEVLEDTPHFFMFRDFSVPSSEFVSRAVFSRDEKDLILFHNKSKWFIMCSGKPFIEDPSLKLDPMLFRDEHGKS